VNSNTEVPDPVLYVATRSVEPVSSVSCGEPPVVSTTTVSENVTVTVIVAPTV
jgi:hypothetical protein